MKRKAQGTGTRGRRRVSRRAILRAGTAATLAAASVSRVSGANDRIGVGFIGYGLRGRRLLSFFENEPDVAISAVAEVHKGRLREGAEHAGGDVLQCRDFRELLDSKDVDAAVIATPDHWHALQTLLACAAGKDVYVEKPLTRFVHEGRWVVNGVRRFRRVVQVGTQQRSGPHYQRARDFIREGKLGEIVLSQVDFHRNMMPGFGNPRDEEPPPDFDWELFTGPAPLRPYNRNRGIYHFRWFWDYAGGQMTNWGAHSLDVVHWYLDTEGPHAVFSTGGRRHLKDNCDTPDTQETILEFDGWTVTISISECSRGRGPASLGFFGTSGALHIHRSAFWVTPDSEVPAANILPGVLQREHPIGGPRPVAGKGTRRLRTERLMDTSGSPTLLVKRHVRNFLDCIKTRDEPISDIESGHRVSTTCHLANISLRVGRGIRWDARKEEILGDREASMLLEQPYRKPWEAVLRSLDVS